VTMPSAAIASGDEATRENSIFMVQRPPAVSTRRALVRKPTPITPPDAAQQSYDVPASYAAYFHSTEIGVDSWAQCAADRYQPLMSCRHCPATWCR
jgi:hypothetical protein